MYPNALSNSRVPLNLIFQLWSTYLDSVYYSFVRLGRHCTQVVKAGFDVNRGLFTSTAEGGLAFPQPSAAHVAAAPALLHFLGLAFGKALYEGILLDTPLAPFFVARLQVQLFVLCISSLQSLLGLS
jgi:hypothetical protein